MVIKMYVYYNPNPRGRWYAGDCVIRAISKAEGHDAWEKIYAGLSLYGFMIGEIANNNQVWDAYLRDNGYIRKILPNSCPYCYTIEDFAREHPEGTYIVATGRHAVAVVDGNYYDAWDSGGETPIYYYYKEM